MELTTLYNKTSSAYRRAVLEIILGMSFTKHKNNNGPRTVPWGTSDVMGYESLEHPSKMTCCDLSVRKSWIQLSIDP